VQCVAVFCAVCCSVLDSAQVCAVQCVAVWCSVLRCVAVWCSMQYVAARSVLQVVV